MKLDAQLDLFIRLSILEGGASVVPGSWTQNQNVGIAEAQKHYGEDLYPAWIATGTCFVKNLRKAILAVEGINQEDMEDLMADIFVGATRPTKMKSALYDIGHRMPFLPARSGLALACHYLSKHGHHRAVSRSRSPWGRMEHTIVETEAETPSFDWKNFAEGSDVWFWLRTLWSSAYMTSPSKMNVLDLKLQKPARTLADISESLGYSPRNKPPAYVSRVVREALVLAAREIKAGNAPAHILNALD